MQNQAVFFVGGEPDGGVGGDAVVADAGAEFGEERSEVGRRAVWAARMKVELEGLIVRLAGMITALILIGLAIYLMPTIVGALLGVPRLWIILLVNVFLGWTIAGWGVALMWVMHRTGVAGGNGRDVGYHDERRFVR